LKEKTNPGLIDGYTPECSVSLFLGQRSGVQKMRDEALKTSKTDPHSQECTVRMPAKHRYFYQVDIKENDGCSLHLKTCRIW
jgi:hypothetical protein